MTVEVMTCEKKADGLPMPRRIWAVLAISITLMMSVLDASIANVVLPTFSKDFGTTPSLTIWIMNAYQLALIVSLLSFSSLGDIYGYRRVYLSGVGLFCITSLVCALSDSFWMLVGARALQGLGAAAITGVNAAQLRTIYPAKYLGRGLAINAMVVAVSAVAGPTVAGAVLAIADWHWLFAMNLPMGAAALIMGALFLPKREMRRDRRFDKKAAVANALTFGLLIYSIEGFAHHESPWLLAILLMLLVVVATWYIRDQLHKENPLLPVDLMKIPIFSLSVVTSVCSFTAQMLALISLPFFFQDSLGRNEIETGLLITPWPVAILFAAPVAGYLVERIHAGLLGGIGMFILATGLYLLYALSEAPSNMDIIWRMAVCGVGFGLFQTPNNSTIISSAPPSRSGGASGMLGTARLLGQTLGASLVAILFSYIPHAQSTRVCLLAALFFSVIAGVVSCLRLSRRMPLKRD